MAFDALLTQMMFDLISQSGEGRECKNMTCAKRNLWFHWEWTDDSSQNKLWLIVQTSGTSTTYSYHIILVALTVFLSVLL